MKIRKRLRTIEIIANGLAVVSLAAAAQPHSPLFFVPNDDRTTPSVKFIVRGSGLTAFFGPSEVIFRMREGLVKMDFPGGSDHARIEALERLPGVANFLQGPPKEWRTGVPLYSGVAYRELYPGIDMLYGSHGRKLKSEFVVAPGADPSRILIRYVGVGPLQLDSDGSLIVPVGSQQVREEPPLVYQEFGTERILVDGRFAVAGDTVGFIIGDYDRTAPLIIDPIVSYSTLLGGTNDDAAMALAVDSAGAAYIAGFTSSYDFPTANPLQKSKDGGNDVFVAKLSPAGTSLVYATYIGGSQDDRAFGIAVDSTGAAYVTGSTTSPNFPVHNPLQGGLSSYKNAFVLKLSPTGNSLAFSTYVGGNGSEAATAIARDPSGNIYVAGNTTSTNFPATNGAFQRSNRGSQDAFIAKLNAAGSTLLYATYLGGSLNDHAAAIAVDASGAAYVTGSTWSTDFPTASAYRSTLAGGQDAFLTRVATNGSSLLFSTYLGGSGGSVGWPEGGNGIALDEHGAAYVTGTTPSNNFPLLNPAQSALRGWIDAFVSKFSAAGNLVYSTYIGGSGLDMANGIAVDSGGNAHIAGYTNVMDLGTTSASSGSYNAFAVELNSTGNTLLTLAYIVDTGSDTASAIALDSFGDIYFAGWTLSSNFPVVSGIQSINGGGHSAFVTKIILRSRVPSVLSVSPSAGGGSSQVFTFAFSDPDGYQSLAAVQVVMNSQLASSYGCYLYIVPSSGLMYLASDAGSWLTPTTIGASSVLQNSQCQVNAAGSSLSGSGTTLTVRLAITFRAAFTGAKNVYMHAIDSSGLDSGWLQKGTWTLAAGGPPVAVSITPSSGAGVSQTFTLTYSDPDGYQSLAAVQVVMNSQLASSYSCYLYIVPSSGLLYLASDAGSWLTPTTIGASSVPQNSQCEVSSAGSSLSGSGTTLTVRLAITFRAAFTGVKNIYMNAVDSGGLDSGWLQKGTWTR